MKHFTLKEGLDVPILGAPDQTIQEGNAISRVALTGDDFIGMKPTMAVKEGDRVKLGQILFTDKKNEGVTFTSPACGIVEGIHRGPKRKFESLVIKLEGEEAVSYPEIAEDELTEISAENIRKVLIQSGQWCHLRTRPYGKIPGIGTEPASLFITAMDTSPLAADPAIIINHYREDFDAGLEVLQNLVSCPLYLCLESQEKVDHEESGSLECCEFHGPHPAGLPSTHIHFIDPVHEKKTVWHIGYHGVICIGHLFRTGQLLTERIISLGGPGVTSPALVKTRQGASLEEICSSKLLEGTHRIISGSILDGRALTDVHSFLGFYHQLVSVLEDRSGRGFFSWASPGANRFSLKPVFISALDRTRKFAMNTALWGGKRAIFPLGTYDQVMPLDIVPITLLKSIAVGDTEKSQALGCLELIEEDLALCAYVCPGKNNFGPMLRNVLTEIEIEG